MQLDFERRIRQVSEDHAVDHLKQDRKWRGLKTSPQPTPE